ncbi:hypothetical protein [Riemerella columbina]|uniref:hypothetical protein n=1 Tax=Riemerella columbina TaxID=103810 RepID=UPI00036A1A9C|nr:hypothetical protein [Riemerella columbina]
MRKPIIFLSLLAVGMLTIRCAALGDSLEYVNKGIKIKKVNRIVYFKPEVEPYLPEIIQPTDQAFYNAFSDFLKDAEEVKLTKINTLMPYDSVDVDYVKEICTNNGAQVALIPKVKYFKVGFGKYVFSNQVLVSAKLYDAEGNFIIETTYDTYKGNARLLGSAENSVKIGAKGVLKKMNKELRRHKINTSS